MATESNDVIKPEFESDFEDDEESYQVEILRPTEEEIFDGSLNKKTAAAEIKVRLENACHEFADSQVEVEVTEKSMRTAKEALEKAAVEFDAAKKDHENAVERRNAAKRELDLVIDEGKNNNDSLAFEKREEKVPPPTFKCPMCEDTFNYKTRLEAHLKGTHPDDKGYNCEECGTGFATDARLAQHVEFVHKKTVVYQCELCQFRASRRGHLNRHVRNVHIEGRNVEKCPFCGFKFGTKGALEKHVQVRHRNGIRMNDEGNRILPCELCEFKTISIELLKEHADFMHNPEEPVKPRTRPFKCQYCPFETKIKAGFDAHVNGRHENPKGIKCRFCDYASGFMTTVMKHEESQHIKAGKLDHLCDKCDYRTHLKSNLIRHMLAYHDRDNLPWPCKLCEFKTSNFAHLRRHIKVMHVDKGKVNVEGAKEYLGELIKRQREKDWTRSRFNRKTTNHPNKKNPDKSGATPSVN